MTRRRRALAVLALGLVGSQAGHLLAYQMRLGAAAQHVQSTGVHAYFPTLAKTTLGALAAAFVGAVFVIGVARVLAGRSRERRDSAPKYIELLSALFTIQLAFFIAQEAGEAMLAGTAVDSAPHVLLWGTLGQLPVAAVTAIALGWVGARFESAVGDLGAVLVVAPAPRPQLVVAVAISRVPDRALLRYRIVGGSLGKRGPPSSLRSVSN